MGTYHHNKITIMIESTAPIIPKIDTIVAHVWKIKDSRSGILKKDKAKMTRIQFFLARLKPNKSVLASTLRV